MLCPACRGELIWKITEWFDGDEIAAADIRCSECGAAYQVREGIGAFLTPDLQRQDLWEESRGQLHRHLERHPGVCAHLIDGPLDDLEPADQFLRAEYLEEEGDFAGAERARSAAGDHIYTPEMNALVEEYTAKLVELVPRDASPVVDVASGRGALIEPLAARGLPLVVSTDFSPVVSRRSRRRLRYWGVDGSVCHLVVDARKTPFCDRSVPSLVSHMGLANIVEGADEALGELRRICRGPFLFTHMFCRPDDPVHGPLLHAWGHPMAFLDDSLAALAAVGWEVEIVARQRVPMRPTPSSKLVPDMSIDAFPVAEAEFDLALLRLW